MRHQASPEFIRSFHWKSPGTGPVYLKVAQLMGIAYSGNPKDKTICAPLFPHNSKTRTRIIFRVFFCTLGGRIVDLRSLVRTPYPCFFFALFFFFPAVRSYYSLVIYIKAISFIE